MDVDQLSRGLHGRMSRGLAELPEDALLHILLHLPADDRARVATLSRRFAALAASPELGVRLNLRCSTVHRLPDAVSARLISKASALTELDVSWQHPERHWVDVYSLVMKLSDAQRQQLTVLRCEPADGSTFLDARSLGFFANLELFPNLRRLDTSVSVEIPETGTAEMTPPLAAMPYLRINRLKVKLEPEEGLDDDASQRLSADLVELFQKAREVCFAPPQIDNPGVWNAFFRAVATLYARGCGTTFSVDALQLASDDHATLERLAALPRVRGLSADCSNAETFSRLLDALASPGCGVRHLTLSGARFTSHLRTDNNRMKLEKLLQSDFPLETLVLRNCIFNDYDDVDYVKAHPVFTQICNAVADAHALTDFQLIGGGLLYGDAAALAMLIRANRNLRSLDVRNVALNQGVAVLCSALCKPQSRLERLALSEFFSDDAPNATCACAAEAVAAALRVNTRLRELHLAVRDPVNMQAVMEPSWQATETHVVWEAIAESTTLRCATLPLHVWFEDENAFDVHVRAPIIALPVRLCMLTARPERSSRRAWRSTTWS